MKYKITQSGNLIHEFEPPKPDKLFWEITLILEIGLISCPSVQDCFVINLWIIIAILSIVGLLVSLRKCYV